MLMTSKEDHVSNMKKHYDTLYEADKTYWGLDPSPLSLLLFSHLTERKNLTLLDLGCGQGPDTLFFAKKGFSVTSVDVSETGLSHLKEIAEKQGTANKIETINVDMQDINELPKEDFKVIFSRMSIQMIPETKREEYLQQLKNKYPNSIHVHIIPINGACFGNDFICKDNLLEEGYDDWDVLYKNKVWTLSRTKNKNGEPYLMQESLMIAKKK